MAGECKMAGHPVYDREKIEAAAEAQALADADAAAVQVQDAPVLGRDLILAAKDLKVLRVYVEDWAGCVHVRQLSGAERDRLDAAIRGLRTKGGATLRATFAAEVLCGPDGARMFTPEDIPALAAKSARALDAVVDAAAAFNGIGGTDQEALRKNS